MNLIWLLRTKREINKITKGKISKNARKSIYKKVVSEQKDYLMLIKWYKLKDKGKTDTLKGKELKDILYKHGFEASL